MSPDSPYARCGRGPSCGSAVRRGRSGGMALAARGENPAAFGRRCIPPGCVTPRSNTPGILTRRALLGPDATFLTGVLGATPDLHHGPLARKEFLNHRGLARLLQQKAVVSVGSV